MEKIKAPSTFNFNDENLERAWKSWSYHLEIYLTATEADEKADKIKIAILLSAIGNQGREIHKTFVFPSIEASRIYTNIVRQFELYCIPRKNTTMHRHKFFSHKQKEGQNFLSFTTEVKRLSEDCDFGEKKDSLVTDVIILGILDDEIRERMLREPEIDLRKAM